MPIYEYRCTNPSCGHVTTEKRKVEERRLPMACEQCEHPAELAPSVPGVAAVRGGTGAQSAG